MNPGRESREQNRGTSRASGAAESLERDATLSPIIDGFGGPRAAIVEFNQDGAYLETSYSELKQRIHYVAAGLQARGVGPGARVGIWAPNSTSWIIAYFAVVAAGGIVGPIDEQLVDASLRTALAKVAPKLLFTTQERSRRVPASSSVVTLDADVADLDAAKRFAGDHRLQRPSIAGSDTAALLLTSGTTGEPKAVPLSHGNLRYNADALEKLGFIDAHDNVVVPLPLHHAYPWMAGVLVVLKTGAAVVLPAGITGPAIVTAARASRATALIGVPRLYESLLGGIESRLTEEAGWRRALLGLAYLLSRAGLSLRVPVGRVLFRRLHTSIGPHLRLFICGGARMDPRVAQRLRWLGWQVFTGYGLTETSPVLTFNPRRHPKLGTAGIPLADTDIRIDRDTGEIEARGPGVFAGYQDQPEADARAFTADRWFRTGDLGYLDAEGFLHITGRVKELIVLADGKKVLPEEVEAAYSAGPFIQEVAIMEVDGRLVALVVPNEAAIRLRGTVRELSLLREEIADAASRLPSYQHLHAYRLTRSPLPRTHLGKLQRHRVRERYEQMDQAPPASDRAELPSTLVPKSESPLVRAVWDWLRQKFPDRELTLDTSPQLELGIDSLEWTTLTLEIERRFGLTLGDSAVSRIVTLGDLLNEVQAAPKAAGRTSSAAFEPARPGSLTRFAGKALFLFNRLAFRALFRLRTKGVENLPSEGGFLIVPNHASYLDPAAVAAALPPSLLARTYWAGWVGRMYTNRLNRWASRALQVFPVDPDRSIGSGIDTACKLLVDGNIVVWFPEGRRTPSGEIQAFLPGLGHILRSSGVGAVPTAIHGSYSAWPKHRRLPRMKRIMIEFGVETLPGPIEGVDPAEEAGAISEEIRARVVAMMGLAGDG